MGGSGPLGDAARALNAGDAALASKALARYHGPPGSRVRDYELYLRGEAAFYSRAFSQARGHFEAVAADRRLSTGGSSLAGRAAFRVADCLWAEGRRPEAATRYRAALAAAPAVGDPAVAHFRMALVAIEAASKDPASKDPAASRKRDEARTHLRAVYVDRPAHPLAPRAAALAATLEPARPAGPVASSELSVPERLKRAETLLDGREWKAALAELGKLPPGLPPEAQAQRDFLLGMTKYRSRSDYPGAAQLLLGAVDRLPVERAAHAAFHGARALSRADRDDEAIAGYERVVARFGHSKWAAEAQFRAGWLDYNRGRFAAGLPRLQQTIARFPNSPWATDAAWCVAFSHYLLGHGAEALAGWTALEARARGPQGRAGLDTAARVAYWRARTYGKAGQADEQKRGLEPLAARAPFSYYGLLARVVLGDTAPPRLERREAPLADAGPDARRDPTLARADELAAAGLTEVAGGELARGEAGVLSRLGRTRGLKALLERYPRMQAFHSAYRLAETYGGAALDGAPVGDARLVWQAAYPRAFADLVDAAAGQAGAPPALVFSIMRKESGYAPYEVSYADARGLLQMIPPTSARVAQDLAMDFAPEDLYEPETNIKLGAAFIAGLYKQFHEQPLLTAGAYNAGPRAIVRWCEQHKNRPADEWVELVTYDQTREYIKRVSAIYARYRFLYDNAVFLPSAALDCRVARVPTVDEAPEE